MSSVRRRAAAWVLALASVCSAPAEVKPPYLWSNTTAFFALKYERVVARVRTRQQRQRAADVREMCAATKQLQLRVRAAADELRKRWAPAVPDRRCAAELESVIRAEANLSVGCPLPSTVWWHAVPDPITEETAASCADLRRGKHMAPPAGLRRVVFYIEAYKQPALVARTIRRLRAPGHAFIVHVDKHVGSDFVHEMAAVGPDVCVLRSGVIIYLTGTDVHSVWSVQRWLLTHRVRFDSFVSLTGGDYPLHDGARAARLLAAAGDVTWYPHPPMRPEQRRRVDGDKDLYIKKFRRIFSYGFGCRATRSYHSLRMRPQWIARRVPTLRLRQTPPLTTGVYAARTVRELQMNDDAVAALLFMSKTKQAAAEHYWASALTLPVFDSHLIHRAPCFMSWHLGVGADGVHNTILTREQWAFIEAAIRGCALFARKFNLDTDEAVLDMIDNATAPSGPPEIAAALRKSCGM